MSSSISGSFISPSSSSSIVSTVSSSESYSSLPSLQGIVTKNILPASPQISKEIFRQDAEGAKINYLQACMNHCGIASSKDLDEKFHSLLVRICQNPEMFASKNYAEHFKFLQSYIHAFGIQYGYHLQLPETYKYEFIHYLKFERAQQPLLQPLTTDRDLNHVTLSYDELCKSKSKIQATSDHLSALLEKRKYIYCPTLIIGAGDTSTTVWLEKHKEHHNQVKVGPHTRNLPILMIGKDMGSWGHDYTLAQRHSFLERSGTKSNPSDYVSKEYYETNPYTNSRHVLQANTVNLAATDAPLLLGLDIMRIEKQDKHRGEDWKHDAKYRVAVFSHEHQKTYFIYTNNIDASTGLGPAKDMIGGAKNSEKQTILGGRRFRELNTFDPEKNFTPIVDGNQFVLTPTEQFKKHKRDIVVYGGGGTGAACYRIAFHDHDKRTEEIGFNEKNQVNTEKWIAARSFDSAGSGRLVSQVFERAKEHRELLDNTELMKIEDQNGKLQLTFQKAALKGEPKPAPYKIECDQLVYSLGQNSSPLMAMTDEIQDDLEFVVKKGAPLCVRTRDESIHFFGAGAMAITGAMAERSKTPNEYVGATWKWLDREHVGRDVGPGSMPPTRAQIKAYLTDSGARIENVNVNTDDTLVIWDFLVDARVPEKIVPSLVESIRLARGEHPFGMSRERLENLLYFYDVENIVKISGHSHLVKA